jgi:glucose/mannose-6-phosphate isomerase
MPTMGDTQAVDSQGMLAATVALPEQIEAAARRAADLSDLPSIDDVNAVVVLGMGGSGIAGDIVAAVAGPFMPVPVVVAKSYELPAFVGEGTLVFAVSFSGDTEETVEATSEAAVQGAKIVVVSGGGELTRLAEAWGSPIVAVPDGIPQPRAAVGALAVPPLIALEQIGLFPGARRWVDEAVRSLIARRDELMGDDGAAFANSIVVDLGRRIGRTIPLIYGGGAIGAAAAQRWKTQMNENAKVPAFWNAQPELCHNEIAGWGQHGDLTRQAITLVALRHDFEHPQVMRRFDLVFRMVDEVVASIEQVQARGEGQLAQLLDLILIGDLTSLHMALSEGIDPGPAPALDEIKTALKES